jgi:cob(I)alamin adenosyltransferase
MTTSTIEYMNGIDSVSMENIPIDKLEEILDSINKKIEKYQQERYEVLAELATREDSNIKNADIKLLKKRLEKLPWKT